MLYYDAMWDSGPDRQYQGGANPWLEPINPRKDKEAKSMASVRE